MESKQPTVRGFTVTIGNNNVTLTKDGSTTRFDFDYEGVNMAKGHSRAGFRWSLEEGQAISKKSWDRLSGHFVEEASMLKELRIFMMWAKERLMIPESEDDDETSIAFHEGDGEEGAV